MDNKDVLLTILKSVESLRDEAEARSNSVELDPTIPAHQSLILRHMGEVYAYNHVIALIVEEYDPSQYYLDQEFIGIMQELGVDKLCAMDVWYLRSISRWSEELEKELIDLHKKGTPPDINGFGCTSR